MKITLIKKISPNKNIVLLGRKNSRFEEFLNTDEEKTYLKNSLGKNKQQIVINQYSRWIFIQLIDEEKKNQSDSLEEIRKAGEKIQVSANDKKLKDLGFIDLDDEPEYSIAFLEGLLLSNYQFLKYHNKADDKKNSLMNCQVFSKSITNKDIQYLDYSVQAVYHARDLVNEPLSFLTAVQLAEEIKKLGEESGFSVEVFDKKKIRSLKMGGLLAVNKGSIDPPTFSILTWKPSNARNKKPYVLVGKGVVYDTGGLSLKPTLDSMDYMKSDMAGAAAVAGTMYAVARAALPVYVIGLIPATDNRPDGNAYVPGDVITMHDGSTVEVLNTDAEGRMILADALSWAKQYEPELVLNLATLTGAAHAAVGKYGIVTMGNAPGDIFNKLKKSGERVFERIAEFPFWDDYSELLKSDIADLKNVGGRYAGAITAGKFLEHFTDYPFIHLDIAGPSYNKTKDSYRGIGSSGVGVRLFFDFLKNL